MKCAEFLLSLMFFSIFFLFNIFRIYLLVIEWYTKIWIIQTQTQTINQKMEDVLKNLAKVTEKHLWQSLIFNKIADNFIKKETLARSSHPGKGVLKICSKITGEHPSRNAISIRLLLLTFTWCNEYFEWEDR